MSIWNDINSHFPRLSLLPPSPPHSLSLSPSPLVWSGYVTAKDLPFLHDSLMRSWKLNVGLFRPGFSDEIGNSLFSKKKHRLPTIYRNLCSSPAWWESWGIRDQIRRRVKTRRRAPAPAHSPPREERLPKREPGGREGLAPYLGSIAQDRREFPQPINGASQDHHKSKFNFV